MKIKNFLCLTILIMTFLLCACDKRKPVILFNNQPINSVTVQAPVNEFAIGETVHYVVYNPESFDSPYLRLQIVKKDTKTQNWGFKIYRSQDIKIDSSKNFYIDYLKIYQSGTYIVSVYYLHDLNRPLVRGIFKVK